MCTTYTRGLKFLFLPRVNNLYTILVVSNCAQGAQLDIRCSPFSGSQFHKSTCRNGIIQSWPGYCPSLEGMSTSLLPYETDILASHQYFKSFQRTNPAEPEKALLFAVLVEAVKTYEGFAFSESLRKQRLFRESQACLWAEEPGGLFSFRGICEVFGFDPMFLRRGLLQWTADRKHSLSRRKKSSVALGRSDAQQGDHATRQGFFETFCRGSADLSAEATSH